MGNQESSVDLLRKLQDKFDVTVNYTVGFDLELSEDAKEIIKYSKGDLFAEDIIPNGPTKLNIILKSKDGKSIIDAFSQNSSLYMPAFDQNEFRDFVDKNLTI